MRTYSIPAYDNLTKPLAFVTIGAAIIVMIGWYADIDILKSVSPAWVSMKFNTALAFLMSGIILYLMNEAYKRNSQLAKIFLQVPVLVILLIITTLFIFSILGIQSGIENLFLKEKESAIMTTVPGRPSIGTMIDFNLIVAASIALLLNASKLQKLLSLVGLAIIVIGGLAIIGYATNTPVLYYSVEGWSTAMAFHTATLFILIGIGIISLAQGKHAIKADARRMLIKPKLMAIFLTGIIFPLILVGALNYSITEQQTIKDASDKISGVATVQKARIDQAIQMNFERLQAVSSRTQLRLSLASYNENGNAEDLERMTKILSDSRGSIKDFKRLSVINVNGIVIASTDKNMEKQYDNEYTDGNLENHMSIVPDPSGEPVIRLFGTLMLEGKSLGILIIDADPRSITGIMQDYTGLGDTGENILAMRDTNGDALMIAPLRHDPNAMLRVKVTSDRTETPTIQATLKHENTFIDTIDYRGKPVLAATRYIESTDWGLVAKIDKAEVLALLNRPLYLTVTTVNIVIVLGIVASIFFARSISDPIRKLRDATNAVVKGNFDTEITATTNDEIRDLTHDFDNMRQSVQQANTNLSMLVELKTQELTKANEKLMKQAEKLHEIDIAKDEFSSMVTHELKTPLVPIRGYCEMLMDGIYGELTQKQKEKIQIIHRNTLDLSRLIQDILDAQKLEMKKMKIDMWDTSAKYLIDTCVNAFLPTAGSKSVRLVKEVEPELKLKCDPDRILQVLNNLVSNALKFVPEQTGTIEISAKRYNDSALFSVKDNGIGIPKEKQQDLFKKFYQVDTSLSRKAGGTGLGLAISKGIINAHNGEIWVESEGEGTTFYFTIPVGSYEMKKITQSELH